MKADPLPLIAVLVSTVVLAAGTHAPRLADAAKNRNVAAVRALLRQKVEVNAPQPDGATALHWAAHWDDLVMANALIRAGAAVNATNDLGVTPLWLACLNGSTTMVERLLNAGSNANAALPSGETPLMTASRTGNPDAVRRLLAQGADVHAREGARGQTALMWAVVQRHPKVVEALLEAGADVRARSDVRPRRVNTDAGGFAAGRTIDIDQGGYTPLLFAAQQGNLDSARLLVAAGASVNDTAPDGTSVLVVASHSGHGSLAIFLLDSGANANAAGSGHTALHAAILRSDPTLARALLAHGADPNALLLQATPVRRSSADYALGYDMLGASPFWLAARFAQPEVMQLLAASGADPAVAAKDGTTALAAAVQGTRRVEPGFTRDPVDDARIALKAVRIAADLGANVNAADQDGNTALHTATQKKLNAVIQFLSDKGAILDVKNKKGQTPLSMAGPTGAAPEGGISTTDLLRKLGAKE